MRICFLKYFAFAMFFAVPLQANAQTPVELYTKADEYYAALQFPQAKSAIDEAVKKSPDSYEILWRAARVYSSIAETLPENQQEAAVIKVKDFADRTINANPQAMQGYLWRGIANGKLALFKGVFGAAELVKSVNQDVKKAIALNNAGNTQLALAYYVLGRMHCKLAEKPKIVRMPLGLGFGNIEEGLMYLKKSVELNPNSIMSHLDYARVLIEEDKYEEARRELLKIPSIRLQTTGDDKRKEEAAVLLKEIRDK